MGRLIPFGSAVKYLTEIALTAGILLTVLQETMGQTYSDVAPAKGINIQNADLDWGGGVSFFDYDQDGTDDLTFADSLRFYDNKESGIKLSPDTFFSQKGLVSQVLWFDYDNDGDNDAFISYRELPNELYENTGDLSFTKKADSIINLSSFSNNTFGVAAGDYNRDGYLDLYVCNYENSGSQSNNSSKYNKLYRNNGNGTFTLADSAGVADGAKPSFQGIWIDYNQDNWPDLYVVNDLTPENSLYRNNGDGTFTEVTNKTKSGLAKHHPMSATAGDFNNNGHLDIYMSNSNLRGRFIDRSGKLLKNTGNGSFREEAKAYGVDIKDWSWGSVWVDYNNDGYQDLYVTTATLPLSQMELNPNILYENVSADTFRKKPDIFLDTIKSRSFAAAKGDLDNDGYYDLFTQNMEPKKARLWKNSDTSNNYVKVTLNGTFSNRMAIGSWIRVYADSKSYSKYTKCGANYLSQNSQHKIFGVGTAKNIDSIVVEYLSGYEDQYYNLTVDTHYYFKEGETENFAIQSPGRICWNDSFTLSIPSSYDSIWWSNNQTGQTIKSYKSGQYWVKAKSKKGFVFTDSVTISKGPRFAIDEKVSHVTCSGTKSGKIALETHGDSITGNYQINWSNGQWGLKNDSLAAGKYIYYLLDGSGCGFNDTVTVNQPNPLNLQHNILLEVDKADSAGILDLTVNGGRPPYTILLDGDTVGSRIENLPVDTYYVQVYDIRGCNTSTEIILERKSVPELTIAKKPPVCAGKKNGKIAVTLADSSINREYRIEWRRGSSGSTIDNLSGGSYVYTYSDKKGAKGIDTVILKTRDSIKIQPSIENKTRQRNGAIGLKINGGVQPYQIRFEGRAVEQDTFPNLDPGLYQVRVIDSNGCENTINVRIKDLRKPDIDQHVENVTCAGKNDGKVVLAISPQFQDSRNFRIKWDDHQIGTKRVGLSPGTYVYTYTDSTGVSLSDTVVIAGPSDLKAHVTTRSEGSTDKCFKTLSIKGGTPPYSIQLNGNFKTNPIKNISSGDHNLSVVDRNGCKLDTAIKIDPAFIPKVRSIVRNPRCANSKDGSIKLDTSSLSLSHQSVTVKWEKGKTGFRIDSVGKGTFRYKVLADNGCTYSDSLRIKAPFPLDVRKQVVRNEANSFRINLAVNGGTPPYQIKVDSQMVKNPIKDLQPGNYKLSVADDHNCKVTDTLFVGPVSGIFKSENGKRNLTVNPNPATNQASEVTIQSTSREQIYSARIIGLSGKIHRTKTFLEPHRKTKISVRGLKAGVYLVNVNLKQRSIWKRLVVQ